MHTNILEDKIKKPFSKLFCFLFLNYTFLKYTTQTRKKTLNICIFHCIMTNMGDYKRIYDRILPFLLSTVYFLAVTYTLANQKAFTYLIRYFTRMYV